MKGLCSGGMVCYLLRGLCSDRIVCSFSERTVFWWNSLPDSVVFADCVNSFKTQLDFPNVLLIRLYIQVPRVHIKVQKDHMCTLKILQSMSAFSGLRK